MSEQSCREEYDTKLQAFLKTLDPLGCYAIYVTEPRGEIIWFARVHMSADDISPDDIVQQVINKSGKV